MAENNIPPKPDNARPPLGMTQGPEAVYDQLRTGFATYEQLKEVPVIDNGEPLVPLEVSDNVTFYQRNQGMVEAVGDRVFVRQGVALRLEVAGAMLNEKHPGFKLGVLEGYRPYQQQVKEFEEVKANMRQEGFQGTEDELNGQAHFKVAAPDVGGHITGGNVDVLIVHPSGDPINHGTAMSDLGPDSYTASPFIDEESQAVRDEFVKIMESVGFKNFGGEYWHFTYGDQEWAYLSGKDHAIYGPVPFKDPALTETPQPLEVAVPYAIPSIQRINQPPDQLPRYDTTEAEHLANRAKTPPSQPA